MHTESQTELTPRRRSQLQTVAVSLSALALTVVMTGCATGLGSNGFGVGQQVASVRVSGSVHGGQQPIKGASVQIYAVGTTGVGSASTPLLTTPATTGDGGYFSIPAGAYDCVNPAATEIYLVASGGDPTNGANNYNNTSINMVAALGKCSDVIANPQFINVNELTTVATAYALAQFTTSVTAIGAATAYDTGLVNAIATAKELVGTGSGLAPGNVAAGEVVPATEINTLGNILASCVNTSDGSSSPCNALYSATSASDTFGAAVAMAKNPGGAAITNLIMLNAGPAPFQPTYSVQPNDFSLAVKYTGSFSTPYGIAIDASGSTVTELGPGGSLLAAPTATNLFGAQGVAIDRTGNVWVANTAGNSVIEFPVSGGTVGTPSIYSGVTAPTAIALDSAGNAFVANFNGNSVTKLSSTGTPAAGSPFTGSGNITVPSGIAVGPSGSVYVTSGNGTVVALNNDGSYNASLNDTALQGPLFVAVDTTGKIFTSGSTTGAAVAGAVGEYTTAGAVSAASPVASGVSTPYGIATDGVSAWVANSIASGSLAQLAYGSATAASPAAGFHAADTQNSVAALNTPVGVAVDASGNVWTANSGDNTVTKFVGLAAPVKTPLAANVGP
jgi:sugar lactone lactonase YvrE